MNMGEKGPEHYLSTTRPKLNLPSTLSRIQLCRESGKSKNVYLLFFTQVKERKEGITRTVSCKTYALIS